MKGFKIFKYAFNGLFFLFKSERNMQIHTAIAILVLVLGFRTGLGNIEWIAIIFCIGLVFMAEAFNTSIEKITDMISPGRNREAGLIKDIAAGAVLLSALTSVVIGAIIFLPKIIKLINHLK